MDFLPQEIEDIITDYKQDIERHERMENIIINYAEINFAFTESNGYYVVRQISKLINTIADDFNMSLHDFKLLYSEDYILHEVAKYINPVFRWNLRFYDYTMGLLKYIRAFQDKIDWRMIGDIVFNSPQLHELPIEFVREFQDKLIWGRVGRVNFLSPLLHELPIEFVREFQDKIDWSIFGDIGFGYPQLHELPIEFVREFQDKIDWYSIIPLCELPTKFLEEFQDKIKYLPQLHELPSDSLEDSFYIDGELMW